MTAARVVDDTAAVRHALTTACRRGGFDAGAAVPVRFGENALFRLPGGVVARVGRAGQSAAATREVLVAEWLASVGVPSVCPVAPPVVVDDRPVTFWRELPPHTDGTPAQIATALRRLHDLDPPARPELPAVAPFVRLAERVDAATTISAGDRRWLRERLAELRERHTGLPAGLPPAVVHGDAWQGNVVSTPDGQVVLLDLERVAYGPPEWDLVHTAVRYGSVGMLSTAEYRAFCRHYGHDVTDWAGFTVYRDIREFRLATMAALLAVANPAVQDQAEHRIACLRGDAGPRPWTGWRVVP